MYGYIIASSFLQILHDPEEGIDWAAIDRSVGIEWFVQKAYKQGGEPVNFELCGLIYDMWKLHQKLNIDYEPLKIIKPQFEIPLPPTQLACFAPIFSELAPPPIELFDLDEAFSSEKTQITQLTNKCFQNTDNKNTRAIDQKELEYFIQECGRILGISHDDQKMSGKEIINLLSVKIANYKKLDKD